MDNMIKPRLMHEQGSCEENADGYCTSALEKVLEYHEGITENGKNFEEEVSLASGLKQWGIRYKLRRLT